MSIQIRSLHFYGMRKEKFRWEKVPEAVQVSPVKKMIVNDFNGDGYPRCACGRLMIILMDVSTGYYDQKRTDLNE